MKKTLLSVVVMLFYITTLLSQQLAFPGAEGHGKYAVGGRNGSVYRVTNLNDSGSGSFRDAVSQPNRIVVFDVAGVIKISSRITVKNNIYIAGQTAPGEGITIYGNGFSFSNANNSIIRYLRVRMGAVGDAGKDAFGIADGNNMIFDHVSVSWGLDETFSINGNADKITIQNCIIGQGLLSHSAGGLMQSGGNITIYRTLYVDNDTRNAKVKGRNQYVNNIVYNWKSAAYIMGGDSDGTSFSDVIGSYFIVGPAGGTGAITGANSRFNIYAKDNWVDKNRNGVLDGYLIPNNEYSGGPTFVSTPYHPEIPTIAAEKVVEELLPTIGASLPYRDYVDWYMVREVQSFGTTGKILSNENQLPFGIPSAWNLWAGIKRVDTDNDGIPDEWEERLGTNKNLNDAMTIASNGYTNIENYINAISEEHSQTYLRNPMCLSTTSANVTQNSIKISWLGYTTKETGYIIEEKISGTWQEIARVGKGVNSYTANGLNPETTHVYRVKCYNETTSTGYTNELTVKTKPVPVELVDITTYIPDVTWTGSASNLWDLSTDNWTPSLFAAGNKVLFNTGATNKEVNIPNAIDQSTIVVKGEDDYSINGVIGGNGSINKGGTGTLTITGTANTYTGATVVHEGEMKISKLANGGSISSIGASPNYDFNWVWNGGKTTYTGGSVTTDRNVMLNKDSEISISQSGTTLTFGPAMGSTVIGRINGEGKLTKSGAGTLKVLNSNNEFLGEGFPTDIEIKEGVFDINVSGASGGANIGTDRTFTLTGGTLRTSSGSSKDYENYGFNIHVPEGSKGTFEPFQNCYHKGAFSGGGELTINLNWLREYFNGDWDDFTGTLIVNGTGSSNQFQINNSRGIPNGRIVTKGSISIICWKNESTQRLGGLSGPAGTYLAGADKQNNSSSMTWIVGGAGTNETFAGIINNECSNASYKGRTSIVKEGEGYWKLSGNNIYSGTTVIDGGNLIINGSHTGTGAITVNEGGTLSGKGSVAAPVTVKSGGILSPSDTTSSVTTGAFTIKNTTTLEAGSILELRVKSAAFGNITSYLTVQGTLNINGKLSIDLSLANPKLGDSYQVLTVSSATIKGRFSEIIPAQPSEGMFWDDSELYTKGVLKVTSASPYPSSFKVSLENKDYAGTIDVASDPKTISIVLPYGTDRSNITPIVTLAGTATSYTPTGAQDFTSGAITYTFSSDTASTDYAVSITNKAPETDATVKSMTINGHSATIDQDNGTIKLTVFVPLNTWKVAYTLNSTFATANIVSGSDIDFRNGSVDFTVTAQDGTTKTYTISVTSDLVTKRIAILTANATAEAYDSYWISALDGYQVTYLQAPATAPADIEAFYANYDMILLHMSVAGGNATGIKSVQMVGKKPILNLKAFFYTNNGRWNWATPGALSDVVDRTVVIEKYKNHPMFSSVTWTNNNELVMFNNVPSGNNKAIQYCGDFNGSAFGANLRAANNVVAQLKGEADKTTIHEIALDKGRNKYLLVDMSLDGAYSACINDNLRSVIRNATSYLLSNNYYDYNAGTLGDKKVNNSPELIFLQNHLLNPTGKPVAIYNMYGQKIIDSIESNIDCSELSNGIYIAKTIDNSAILKFKK